MSNHHNTADTFFSLIKILGFDIEQAEQQYKVIFNAQTFTKPNVKAFEIIIHYLLNEIDSEYAQKVFRTCWPILIKEQQKEFKDVVFQWLNELHRKYDTNSTTSIKIPLIAKSLLISPNGNKLYELLFSLGQLILFNKLAQNSNLFIIPKLSIDFNKTKTLSKRQHQQLVLSSNVLKRRIKIELNEFDRLIQTYLKIKLIQKEYSDDKLNKIRELIDKRQELKSKLDEIQSQSNSNYFNEKSFEFNNYLSNIIKSLNLFNNINNLSNINEFIKLKQENNKLDSLKHKFDIPRLLLLKTNNIDNLLVNNSQLDLIR